MMTANSKTSPALHSVTLQVVQERTGQFSYAYVASVPRTDRRAGCAVDPFSLNHFGAVLAHLRDVADECPDPVRRCVDVEGDFCPHGIRP